MANKVKTRVVNIDISQGAFTSILKRFVGEKGEYEFSGLKDLKQILSNEKAKILYTIRHQNPSSIYQLAKILKRDFKSVQQDVKQLEKFGFLNLEPATKGKRKMLKPVLIVSSLQVNFDF